MFVAHLEVTEFFTNCYLIACSQTLEAAVIDPGGEAHRIIKAIQDQRLKVRYIINTHGHIDHVGANVPVKEATGAEVLIHRDDQPYLLRPPKAGVKPHPADRTLEEGTTLLIGRTVILKVLHTPGHTPGGICLVGDGFIFTGDTLFAGSIGRTDFPGGSYRELMRSIKKLLAYPDETVIYPGHGPSSTLGVEKATNPFLLEVL